MVAEAELARACRVQRNSENCVAGGAKCGPENFQVKFLPENFNLKIPGVARRERSQQKVLPTLMAGALLETARAIRYEVSVSTLLLSMATYLTAGIPSQGLGSQRAVRGETPVLPTCSPPEEGRQSSVRETHQDQLRNRAGGTKTPRSRLAGSTTQYVPARPHFHPLPCLAQTSRFVTWDVG